MTDRDPRQPTGAECPRRRRPPRRVLPPLRLRDEVSAFARASRRRLRSGSFRPTTPSAPQAIAHRPIAVSKSSNPSDVMAPLAGRAFRPVPTPRPVAPEQTCPRPKGTRPRSPGPQRSPPDRRPTSHRVSTTGPCSRASSSHDPRRWAAGCCRRSRRPVRRRLRE